MALANYVFTLILDVDGAGNSNVGKNVPIEIRNADAEAALVTIYSDENGLSPISQPGATTNELGKLSFWVERGLYQVYVNGQDNDIIAVNGYVVAEDLDSQAIQDKIDELTIQANQEIEEGVVKAVKTTGYFPVTGSFEDGGTITEYNQVLLLQNADGSNGAGYYSWAGALPKTVASSSTPSTTGGIGNTAWSYRADAKLRTDLAGGGVSGVIHQTPSIKSLEGVTLVDRASYFATGFYLDTEVGGGQFIYDASRDKADHNGGTVITPEAIAAWDGTQGNLSVLLGWTGTGTGAFVRESGVKNYPENWGAVGDGVADDYLSCKAAQDSGIPVRGKFGSSYRLSQGIDCEGKPLNWTANSPVFYTPNYEFQTVITLDSDVDDDAVFYFFNREGWKLQGFAVTSTANFSQDGSTRKVTIDKNQSALKTSADDGQKFFDVSNLTVRGFANFVKFRGEPYNWGQFKNIKTSYCVNGIAFVGNFGSSQHNIDFYNIHFANTQAGVVGCEYDFATNSYNIGSSSNIAFQKISRCVFEFMEYGVIAGSGVSGQNPIVVDTCWFENIAQDALRGDDIDFMYWATKFQGIGGQRVNVTYGSRAPDDRYNKSAMNVGIIDAVVANVQQFRDINPRFHGCSPEYWIGGSAGNPDSGDKVKDTEFSVTNIVGNGGTLNIPIPNTETANLVHVKGQVVTAGETTRSFSCMVNAIASGTSAVFGECHRGLSTTAFSFSVSGSDLVLTNNSGYAMNITYEKGTLYA